MEKRLAAGAPDLSKEPDRIARMFDDVARRYDTLNHLLSAGFDRGWRKRAIRELGLTGRERVLDVCTGTGDLAIAAVTARRGGARTVVGVDFAREMLRLGMDKVRRAGLADRVHLALADATALPLTEDAFDAATVAFGIRNVANPVRACGEILRVLRPGGTLAILEFGSPRRPALRAIYAWYFHAILPRIGRLISRHDAAYSYLPTSVDRFPSPDTFAETLRACGFDAVRYVPLTAGVVYLYVARKPRQT